MIRATTRGTTLLELSVALAVAGLLGALAAPRLAALLASAETDTAARRLQSAIATARAAAVVRGRPALLLVSADSLVIRVVTGADTARIWSAAGPSAQSVVLTGPDRTLSFGPSGLARGVSNATFRLSRGTAVRQVVMSRLGRTRVLRQP
ncbi:MAG TPA: GspH/FimT family pseudopilin [Gemmatimonadales bacterium]|nr:GspH/FimT family pseudopilin [Gemmatimonadales bacterium]